MIYLYDGTIEGLFTVIFNAYKVLEEVDSISKRVSQVNSKKERIKCPTEEDKALRVRKSIIKNFSYSFYDSILKVFAVPSEKKEIAIARTLKKLYLHGFYYLESDDKDVKDFKNLLDRVSGEINSCKNIPFEEKKGLLFAKFQPQNDILYFVYRHFNSKLANKSFVIADFRRNKAVIYNGEEGKFFEFEMSEDMKSTDAFFDLWLSFYDEVAPDKRKRDIDRMGDMQRSYWSHMANMPGPRRSQGK